MTTARPLGRRATLFSVLAIGTVLFGLVLAVQAGAGTSSATPRLTSRASVPTATKTPEGVVCGGAITINDAGPATPYPSTCVVSGLSGSITDVNVQINGLSHTYPDDIDMLLVSPSGQNAIFMSDAGGSFDVVNCDLTIDDEAPAVLPDGSQLACPGSYQPANYEPGDPFPAPAPAPSGSVALSTFDGGSPNGTWSLYVVDDAAADVGSITSWSLTSSTRRARHRRRLRHRLLRRLHHRLRRHRRLRPSPDVIYDQYDNAGNAFLELAELRGLEQPVRRRARRRLRRSGRRRLEHPDRRRLRRVLQRPGPGEQRERELLFEQRQQPAGHAARRRARTRSSRTARASRSRSAQVSLGQGTYWVSVQANQNLIPQGQWGWRDRTRAVEHQRLLAEPGQRVRHGLHHMGCPCNVRRRARCRRAGSGLPAARQRGAATSASTAASASAPTAAARLRQRGRDHDQRRGPCDSVPVDLRRLRAQRSDHGRQRARSTASATPIRTTSTCCSSRRRAERDIMSDAGGSIESSAAT